MFAAVQEGAESSAFATKRDIDDVSSELKAVITALRSELRQAELRLEAKTEAVRSDMQAMKAGIMDRIFGLVLGALVINIVAMVGAIFAAAIHGPVPPSGRPGPSRS